MEIYGWNQRPFLTSNQIKKLKKKMKKSFKKADEIKKKMEEIERKEIKEADNFLDKSLDKI